MRYLAFFATLLLLAACNLSGNPSDDQQDAADVPLSATSTQHASSSNSDAEAPTAESSSACPARADWFTYEVVSGDALGAIAARSGTSVEALSSANCLTNADNIWVGQVLRVPVRLTSQSNTLHITPLPPGALPMVGEVAGKPDLDTCWALNSGTQPIVYDNVDGNALARLANRAVVIAARATGWVQIDFVGGANIADSKGWMRNDDITLIGPCTETTGVDLTVGTPQVGNPGGVPTGVCAVAVVDPTTTIPVYMSSGGRQFSNMRGWGEYVNTQGSLYQVKFDNGQTGWVDSTQSRRINC